MGGSGPVWETDYSLLNEVKLLLNSIKGLYPLLVFMEKGWSLFFANNSSHTSITNKGVLLLIICSYATWNAVWIEEVQRIGCG